MSSICFTIPVSAIPVQGGGKRTMIRNGKPRFFKDKRTSGYESALYALALPHRPRTPISGPVHIVLRFIMARPKTLMRRKDSEGKLPCTKRPDWDNLAKGVLDPLTKVGFWLDDSQICSAYVEKDYAEKGGAARIEVEITALPIEHPAPAAV